MAYRPRLVEAAIARSFDITELLLVLGSGGPGSVSGRRGQHHEERLPRAPLIQEVKGPVQLEHRNSPENVLVHLQVNSSYLHHILTYIHNSHKQAERVRSHHVITKCIMC